MHNFVHLKQFKPTFSCHICEEDRFFKSRKRVIEHMARDHGVVIKIEVPLESDEDDTDDDEEETTDDEEAKADGKE